MGTFLVIAVFLWPLALPVLLRQRVLTDRIGACGRLILHVAALVGVEVALLGAASLLGAAREAIVALVFSSLALLTITWLSEGKISEG